MDKKSSVIVADISKIGKEYLRRIASIYLNESLALFDQKAQFTYDDTGKWYELVYCILAGTQYPVYKLKPIFKKIIEEKNESFNIQAISKNHRNATNFLKKEGYRYYNQKSFVLFNAARYFGENYDYEISNFLNQKKSIELRFELVNNVKGIGIKIASHWLRNIGYEICTIDIHLRRFLYNIGVSNENGEGSINSIEFISLENQFHLLSKILSIPLGPLQYSIWEYTRNYCLLLKCKDCPLLDACYRGAIYKTSNIQLDIF